MKTLKKLLTFGLVLSGIYAPKALATDVRGILSSDTTWEVEKSPYVVTGSVTVASGVTLTIEAGVEVKIDSGKGILVKGSLVAIGTDFQKILFSSNQASPAAGDWAYIKFTDGSVDAGFDGNGDYVSGSILKFCQVMYGGGEGASGGIVIDTASPYIEGCTVDNNNSAGIIATDPPNLQVKNTIISNTKRLGGSYDTSGGGLVISGGNATIGGNTISNNKAYQRAGGIILTDTTGQVLIDDNVITGNSAAGNQIGVGGILINRNRAKVTITNNQITANDGSSGYGWAGGGVKLASWQEEILVENNNISNNVFAGGWEDGAGIDIKGSSWEGNGDFALKVINNEISGNKGRGINIWGGNAITIEGNKIRNSSGYLGIGLYIRESSSNVIVKNNLVEGSQEYGIAVSNGSNHNISGNQIFQD